MVLKQHTGRGVAVTDRKTMTMTMIQQKQLKGKLKVPCGKLRTTLLNKNVVGFTQQDHHLENFMA